MNYQNKTLANTLKDAGCQIFLNALDKVDGAKDLVLSDSILVQLDSICGMQKLRQNAVDKVFKLQAEPQISDTSNRVYVIRSTVKEVLLVANQINGYLTRVDDRFDVPTNVKFWIILLPRLCHYCDLVLEEEGIHEYVNIIECPLGLIPIEYDVYSMENDCIFRSLYLNRDTTYLNDIVDSIQQLQLLSGDIAQVHGLGRYAEIVAKKMDEYNLKYSHQFPKRKQTANEFDKPGKNNDYRANCQSFSFKDADEEEQEQKQGNNEPSFTDIYLVDRDSDYVSVLLSQLHYEGILDESFNLCCNKLEYTVKSESPKNSLLDQQNLVADASKLSSTSADKTVAKHSLIRESDPIYRDIRDSHFSTVFSLLKTKNGHMKEKYKSSQDMNISNLKNFVANELKILQAEFKCLSIHISACEEIITERNKYDFSSQLNIERSLIEGFDIKKSLEFITKMISHKLNPYVALRLLALVSLTQGGLLPRDYRKFHSAFCEKYGLFNNDTFVNLKKLGLVTEMDLSLNALTGGLINYSSTDASTGGSNANNGNLNSISSKNNSNSNSSISSSSSGSKRLASITGAMSSFTERASGRVVAAVSSSVLPRRSQFSAILKRFQLIPEFGDSGYNIREPKDPGFVFGGAYIPLVCQLVDRLVLGPKPKESSISSSSSNLNITPDLLKLLPSTYFKRKQTFLDNLGAPNTGTGNSLARSTSMNQVNSGSMNTIAHVSGGSVLRPNPEKSLLLFFIGGVTYAEITALRFIAKQRKVNIGIAATSIINGNKLINSVLPVDQSF